jgi:amino acid transporter
MSDRQKSPGSEPDPPSPAAAPRRQLSLLDCTSIIVGVIIGAGIYETTPIIAANVPDLAALVGVWVAGGLIALVGALCFAELATAYPHEGGDYVYLTRAYGPGTGFVFAWADLWVVRPGSIGFIAYVFARYANQLLPLDQRYGSIVYAAGSIVILTAINILGVQEGKWTQNVLTAAKVLGLSVVFAVGFLGPATAEAMPAVAAGATEYSYKLAMILIMFTYGGWSEVAYVAAEIRDPRRNILRALVVGIGLVSLIYVAANLAFVAALGLDGVRRSPAVAAEVLSRRFTGGAGQAISLLVCLSALGAINGQLFTGARIYYALGNDHPLLARLGRWSPRLGTPVWSLAAQGVVTLVSVVGFGLYPEGPRRLIVFTAPVFWFFFLLVGIAVFILRRTDADAPRPYRVFAYPWTPLLFCFSSLFMLYNTFAYAIDNKSFEALWAVAILAMGYLLSFWAIRARRDQTAR